MHTLHTVHALCSKTSLRPVSLLRSGRTPLRSRSCEPFRCHPFVSPATSEVGALYRTSFRCTMQPSRACPKALSTSHTGQLNPVAATCLRLPGGFLLLGNARLPACSALGESARDAELGTDTVDAVRRVEVLDDQNLEASGATLARSNDRPGHEELPNLEHRSVTWLCHVSGSNFANETYAVPSLAVLGRDLLLVADPVSVPPPQGCGVVHTDGVDA